MFFLTCIYLSLSFFNLYFFIFLSSFLFPSLFFLFPSFIISSIFYFFKFIQELRSELAYQYLLTGNFEVASHTAIQVFEDCSSFADFTHPDSTAAYHQHGNGLSDNREANPRLSLDSVERCGAARLRAAAVLAATRRSEPLCGIRCSPNDKIALNFFRLIGLVDAHRYKEAVAICEDKIGDNYLMIDNYSEVCFHNISLIMEF